MNHRIFALVGPHASGKSTLASQLMSMGIHYIPTYTTVKFHGRDHRSKIYRQMALEEFEAAHFIVRVSHHGDQYGILKEDILAALNQHELSFLILSARGISQLSKLIKRNLVSIYLMADYVTLVDRMLKMHETNEEIKKHLQYAEANKEFEAWKMTTHVVKNVGEKETALMQILALMGLLQPVPEEEFGRLTK